MVLKPGTGAAEAEPSPPALWNKGRRGVLPAFVELVQVLGSWRLERRSSTADSLAAVRGVGVEGEPEPGWGRFKLGGRANFESLGLPKSAETVQRIRIVIVIRMRAFVTNLEG